MVTQEEAMGCKEYIQIMKRKRNKRPRQSSPLDLIGAGGRGGDNSGEIEAATATPASSGGFKDSTQEEEEEEDMANCLIRLGQGQSQKLSKSIVSRGYECKTCARCFTSFQALGGHRASHKKSPIGDDEKKKSLVLIQEKEEDQIDGDRMALSLQTPNHRRQLSPSSNDKKKYSKKVHECSVCGAEFSSGQALGGHMRRHRTITSTSDHHEHDQFQQVKKSKNNFSFDLNLPAPEDEDDDDDDHRHCNTPFASEGQVIVFSASSLVDCHY